MGPVDYTIVFRKYFLAFAAHFYENYLKFFSAVGINPESYDWTVLFNKLSRTNNVGFAGDYSGWDGHLSPEFIMATCDVINEWYGDDAENELVRRVLFDELVHTQQVAINTVYYTHIGNPSGNPYTVILNTIVGAMYLMYVWFLVAPKEYNSGASFDQEVELAIYGDDNEVVPSPEASVFFNPDVVTQELAKLDLKYTAADKNGQSRVS